MQNKSLLIYGSKQLETDRLNPQFIGIGKQYVKTHNKRRQIQLQAKQVMNNVSYLQKQKNNTSKKLQKKQQEYEILMAVISRRQADNDRKETIRREREEMLLRQKEENMRRRIENQEKKRNAFLQLHSKNYQNYDSMRNTLIKNEQMRKTFRMQQLSNKKNLVESISQQKQQGKRKVNHFFKQRNDSFTMSYKQKIKQERQEEQKANEQIKEMSNKKQELKLQLDSSNGKLMQLKVEIESIGKIRKSRIMDNNISWRHSSLKGSENGFQTKQQSGAEMDANLQKMIQKELNINDSSFSKL